MVLENEDLKVSGHGSRAKFGKRGKAEYKRPLDLDEHSKEDIEVHVVLYEQVDMEWCYCPGKTKVFQIWNVNNGR